MHICFFGVLYSNGSTKTQHFTFENKTLKEITYFSSHNRAKMELSKLKLSRSWGQIIGDQKTCGNVRNLPLIYKLLKLEIKDNKTKQITSLCYLNLE